MFIDVFFGLILMIGEVMERMILVRAKVLAIVNFCKKIMCDLYECAYRINKFGLILSPFVVKFEFNL